MRAPPFMVCDKYHIYLKLLSVFHGYYGKTKRDFI